MTMIQRLLAMITLLAVAACGGGGGSAGSPIFGDGDSGAGGGSTAAVSDLDISLPETISNSGTGTVTATITALDVNGVATPGAAVTVSADSGAILTIAGGAGTLTNAAGQIVATVAIGSDRSNRDITITATAGTVTRSDILKVVDSPVGNVPASIEVLAAATTAGTAGDGVQILAFVKDGNNNGLPGATVNFRASSGILSSVSTVTDASGSATATFSAGADKSNRSALITVSSGAVSSSLTLPITGTRLTLSGPSSMILGTATDFDLVVTDSKGNVVPNVAVTGVSSLGNALVASSGTTTNSSGQLRFRYTATNPGTDTLVFSGAGATASPTPALVVSGDDFSFVSPAASSTVAVGVAQTLQVRLRSGGVLQPGKVISFAATGGTLSAADATTDSEGIAAVTLTSMSAGPVTVQATVAGSATSTTLPLVIVATEPAKLVLQITPTAVAPNIGASSGNQALVMAKVTDAAGNPVQGQMVNFTRVTDASGGNLLQASATTDASGQATVAYRPGSESTANNGVVLRATVAGAPSVTGTASLTVNQTALFIALGTGNVIQNADPETYRKDWVVYVTDSNGIPVNGVTLTIKAIPTFYFTGRLRFIDPVWQRDTPIYKCRNEDRNNNGILDADEDDNGDGVLWPGNVVGVSPGIVQTVNGRVTISLTYAESYVPWVKLRLTASATVSGTESRTDAEFDIVGLADDFTDETVRPAGVLSPFGLLPTDQALGVAGACELI